MKWACYFNYLLLGAIAAQWIVGPDLYSFNYNIGLIVFVLGFYHVYLAAVLLFRDRQDRLLWYYVAGLVAFVFSFAATSVLLTGFLVIALALYFTVVLHLKMQLATRMRRKQ